MEYRFLKFPLQVLLCFFVVAVMLRPVMAEKKVTTDGISSFPTDPRTQVAEQISCCL